MINVEKKFTGLVFGEGRNDKNFLIALINLEKFKRYTKKWAPFAFDNGKGCSAEDVLKECRKKMAGNSYDIVLCFIDLDDLKISYPRKWKSEKRALEEKYKDIYIIWQFDKLEDELKRVIGNTEKSKYKVNKKAIKDIKKFINSDYYNRIKTVIQKKEFELLEQLENVD